MKKKFSHGGRRAGSGRKKSTGPKQAKISFTLSEDTRKLLVRVAKAENVPVSNLITDILMGQRHDLS